MGSRTALGGPLMRRTFAFLILALCFVPLSRVSLAADDESAEAARFWTADRLHTILIRISSQQWRMMQPGRVRRDRPYLVASAMPRPSMQPSTRPVLVAAAPQTQPMVHIEGERLDPNFYGFDFAYVKAAFECDGITLKDVGFRQRGNSSYNWGASGYKRPYKLDFNRFVEGQKFNGLTGFYLNNNAYDPSLLRETLAYQTFRELGVPAPRTTFALLYLTIEGRLGREFLGLYTLIESVDSKAFLKNHFASSKGLLLKPWSIRGLPYMGEEWRAYTQHYNPRTDLTPLAARRTIDLIKLVNYADDVTFRQQIEGYLNVDKFLRFVAGHAILANLDTIFYTGHNFYLYLNPNDNRFYFMPWDLNLAFANFTSAATVEQHLHLSISRPHTGEAKIIDRLLAVPQYNEVYRNHIKQFMAGTFNSDKLFPRIDGFQAVLAQADQAADTAWKARFIKPTTNPSTRPVQIPPRPIPQLMGWQGQPAIPLKTFITRRIESLNAQLTGETDGFTPGYHRPPNPPPGGLRADPAFGSLPAIASAALRAADANCDSKLTHAELLNALRESFASADTVRQNSLDQPALAQAISRILQRVAPQRRGDRGSRRAPARQADPGPLWANAVLKAVDTDKTGRLTLPQLLAAADRALALADRDKSARLDEDELLALLDSLAAAAPPPPATRPSTEPAR